MPPDGKPRRRRSMLSRACDGDRDRLVELDLVCPSRAEIGEPLAALLHQFERGHASGRTPPNTAIRRPDQRLDRPYLPGDRGAWIKTKCLNRAEVCRRGMVGPGRIAALCRRPPTRLLRAEWSADLRGPRRHGHEPKDARNAPQAPPAAGDQKDASRRFGPAGSGGGAVSFVIVVLLAGSCEFAAPNYGPCGRSSDDEAAGPGRAARPLHFAAKEGNGRRRRVGINGLAPSAFHTTG
jgi:hypothetical protein